MKGGRPKGASTKNQVSSTTSFFQMKLRWRLKKQQWVKKKMGQLKKTEALL